jgi:hypothetical protein
MAMQQDVPALLISYCVMYCTVVQLVVPLVLRINLMWVFYAIYQVEMHVFNFVLEA